MLESVTLGEGLWRAGQCWQKPPRVLVVDDDPEVLSCVTELLGDAGFEVSPLDSCERARVALAQERFQLLVTDLYLEPEGLGYELAEAASHCEPEVPAILLTGRPSLDNCQEAMRAHFSEMVVKPINPKELLAACRRVVTEAAMRRRHEELLAQNRVLARILPKAIEAKDPTTSGHAERVLAYADGLAQRCRLSASEREALRLASLLHDIGKIAVPEHILCKQGPLSSDEREVIKRHPQVGYEILEPMVGSDEVRTWVYQHHERWDGRGYPEGLRGDDVALPGRILILTEVYDALAEARSYKPRWSTAQIVEYFRFEAGKHFDPELAMMVADGVERMGNRYFAAPPGMLF